MDIPGRWREPPMFKILSPCVGCKHNHHDGTCEAFPEGIPDNILLGKHDHRTPYPGDGGLTFKPKESS